MNPSTEKNKATVLRFNRECIGDGKLELLAELVADEFVNHTAIPGAPGGREGMRWFLENILKRAFSDLTVHIHEQVAETDLVATRKTFYATHTGELMGIPPTNRKVTIEVMDFVRLKDGKYVAHWGMSNLRDVIAELGKK